MTLPRLLFLVLVLFSVGVGVTGVLALTGAGDPRPVIAVPDAPPTSPDNQQTPPTASPGAEALAILHAWDVRRAGAWAAGDVRALGELYTEASEAGRRDRAMLRRWVDRGLHVREMRVQVIGAQARVHTNEQLILVVTDRLAQAEAVGAARAGVRHLLPQDTASTWTVSLRKIAGEWRVESVRAQASPAASTARTLRSRKS